MSATNQTPREQPHARKNVPEDEDDYTSSSGSSSEESESEDESDNEEMTIDSNNISTKTDTVDGTSIQSIPGRPKPQIYKMKGDSDLLSRLSSFLPKMKDANEDLEKEIAAGRGDEMVLDSVDENKDYIEMNLGLGVLKEKRGDGEDSSSDEEMEDESPEDSTKSKEAKTQGKSDVMDKLMGGKKAETEKPSIEEMTE